MPPKKDLLLATIIGAAVGILIQPMLSTLSVSLAKFGITPTIHFRMETFFAFLIFAPFALTVAYFLGKLWSVLYQFAKFGAVGTLNSFIDFGVLNLLIALTGISTGFGYVAFKGVSFLAATTNSFFWNKGWTFGSKETVQVGKAAKFYLIAVVGWGLDVVAASAFVNGIHHTISNNVWANLGGLVGIGASFVWNFLGYKYFVFKAPEGGVK